MKKAAFYIKLSLIPMLITFLLVIMACTKKLEKISPSKSAQTPIYAFADSPTWSDEFNGSGAPLSTNWAYDIGGGGWGNGEAQYYTNQLKNAGVSGGILTITAIKEDFEGKKYTSARLVSKHKFDFLYGRIEAKAKLPKGRGTWPAIWMLPTDNVYGGWPKSGEVDIMEHVGFDQDRVHFSVHTEAYNHTINTQKNANVIIKGASDDFHLYRVDWFPDSIAGYVDNKKIFIFKNEKNGYKTWPFDKPFHLLLNIAVGGGWGGQKGIDDSIWPQKMDVDYIRYYKLLTK